jgi:hypothetical protein
MGVAARPEPGRRKKRETMNIVNFAADARLDRCAP